MPEAMLHADARGKFLCALAALFRGHAQIEHRHLDVLHHGQLRNQMEALEDEAQVLEPMVG